MGVKYVYLPLLGRIGNQLFEYAFAYSVQKALGEDSLLVIDESDVLEAGWINSLRDYDLPNVIYVENKDNEYWNKLGITKTAFFIYNKYMYDKNPQVLYAREKRWQRFLNKTGLIVVVKGYADYWINSNRNNLVYGYFQSERFFADYKNDIIDFFNLSHELTEQNYPYMSEIQSRNSVCISIKVEHNLGSPIYDICDEDYYKNAIEYIETHVEKPLYFICSDNVELAKEKFFQGFEADIICQPKDYPVSLTLSAMSKCKHFIINNTSFGWWAQYLASNSNKIVVAPSRWMNNTDPVSIYDNQDSWHVIDTD